MAAKRLLLVDGNSLANRAFYALPPLSNNEGMQTGAVFGFLTMMFRFLSEKRPSHVVVAFDHPSKTFRHTEYVEYKATRKPSPQEFKAQIPLLKEALDTLNLVHVELPGYEADDIIGTLARRWEERGLGVTILSGDKDCLQLVDENVEAILPVKGISQVKEYTPDSVKADMGITPEQVRDYKALAGDSSDNIPGVKGIGEKTALTLLGKYGSIEGIYENLDDVSPAKVHNLLEAGRESAFLSKKLATINTEAPLPDDDSGYLWAGPDMERARTLCTKMQFHSLTPRLASLAAIVSESSDTSRAPRSSDSFLLQDPTALFGEPSNQPNEPASNAGQSASSVMCRGVESSQTALVAQQNGDIRPVDSVAEAQTIDSGAEIQIIDSGTKLAEFAEEVLASKRLAIYAGSPEVTKDFMWPGAIGLSSGGGPCLLKLPGVRESMQEEVWEYLVPLLIDASVEKIGFDLKWVLSLCFKRGIIPRGRFFDILVAAYLLDPTRTNYRMDDLCRKYTGLDLPDSSGLFSTGEALEEQLATFAQLSFAVAGGCAKDLTEAGLTKLAEEVEFPLIEVLAGMEAMGIRVDLELGRSIRQGFSDALINIENDIYNMAGEKFNLGSPKQLSQVLFEKLGLKPVKKTKTGFSTDAEVLEILGADHPIPARILDYRQYAKLKSTYLDVLEDVINPSTGRIHSTFHQTVTATGRLSSSEPNLQNIPIRGELGRSLRRIFIPAEGRLFLASDYSQIELRIMAHMADDPSMIGAFVRDEDIHTRTASEIFGVPIEQVDHDLRGKAKAVNFGIIYGISDYGLARNTGVSRAEARSFIEMYFARYPKVKEFMDEAIAKARADGYVTTILGRRRAIPDIDSRIRAKRGFAERTAINSPIQGSAADIVKVAMVRIYDRLRRDGLISRLILQVHDELIFEIPPEEENVMRVLVKEEMEGAMTLKVPIKVEIDVGKSWFDV